MTPQYAIYGVVRDSNGMPYVHNDEDLRLIPIDVWNNIFTEDERQYLLKKHGPHNRPMGA